MLFKLIKFGFVGFSGLIIDFGITYLLKEHAGWNKFVANGIGFLCAVLNNYLLNRIWTFQNHDPDIAKQISLFMLVSMCGLILNSAMLYYLNEKRKQNFYFSKILVIMVVFCWNFFINSFITFS